MRLVQKLKLSSFPDTICFYLNGSEFIGVGSYELKKDVNDRCGLVEIYNFDQMLLSHKYISCKGILDIDKMYDTFVCAQSNSQLGMFDLQAMDFKSFLAIKSKDCIVLSNKYMANKIFYSTSNGTIGYATKNETRYMVSSEWKAHEYESWIVCPDNDLNVIYSGGDDCLFKSWDLRCEPSKCSSINNYHTMGITSISVMPEESYLATGSFDERLCIWDKRNLGSNVSKPIHEIKLDGGIWRTKWGKLLNENGTCLNLYVLLAAMHGGTYVLKYDSVLGNFHKILRMI